MQITPQNSKIIFGLKIRQLRTEKELSLTELSKVAGLSISYLTEIEKGKKKPRKDKVKQLAAALGSSYEELVSTELNGQLAAIGQLLHSNFLNELPLDLFGIELSKVVEIIANSPIEVGAFIASLVELSRSYAFKEENFYFHALRAYQELNYNYIEEVEAKITTFIKQYDLPNDQPITTSLLKEILINEYNYIIEEVDFDDQPVLKSMRSVYKPKLKKLFINRELNEQQKALQLGKELAYNFLKLKERITTSSFITVKNFDTVLNNYLAGYFAVGILVNKDALVKDLKTIFQHTTWEPQRFLQLLDKYNVSPEVLFQRFNVLPHSFNIKKIFFLRMLNRRETHSFQIDKELHLNRKHQPHANQLSEHYCRRWSSIQQLELLTNQNGNNGQPVVGIQRSTYTGTQDEYLCFTVARPSYFPFVQKVSVTIGLLVDEELKKAIHFLDDPVIPRLTVGVTCERCDISDCQERMHAPVAILNKQKRKAIQEAVEQLK